MKIIQLLVAHDPADAAGYTHEEYHQDLLTANPLFLTVEGAEAYVLKEVNETREDHEEPPLPWIEWLDMLAADDEVSQPRRRYICEISGLYYDLVEVEVQS